MPVAEQVEVIKHAQADKPHDGGLDPSMLASHRQIAHQIGPKTKTQVSKGLVHA